MKSILINPDGELKVINIRPDDDKIREILSGPVDTIRLFSDVVTYIKRSPGENENFNRRIHGVKGPVLIMGGTEARRMDLTDTQISNLKKMFGD